MERLTLEQIIQKEEKNVKNKWGHTIDYLDAQEYLKELTGNRRIRKKDIYNIMLEWHNQECDDYEKISNKKELEVLAESRNRNWDTLEAELTDINDEVIKHYIKNKNVLKLGKAFVRWTNNSNDNDKNDFLNNKNNFKNNDFINECLPYLTDICTEINKCLHYQFQIDQFKTPTINRDFKYNIESDYVMISDVCMDFIQIVKLHAYSTKNDIGKIIDFSKSFTLKIIDEKHDLIRKAKVGRYTRKNTKKNIESELIKVSLCNIDGQINTIIIDDTEKNMLSLQLDEFENLLTGIRKEIFNMIRKDEDTQIIYNWFNGELTMNYINKVKSELKKDLKNFLITGKIKEESAKQTKLKEEEALVLKLKAEKYKRQEIVEITGLTLAKVKKILSKYK